MTMLHDVTEDHEITEDRDGSGDAVRVHADHRVVKHLGHWTQARRFRVRARSGAAVLDLRSPRIADGDIEVAVDIEHGMLKLLLPVDATVDQWGVAWTGRGRVKDGEAPDAGTGRRVRLTGRVATGEIRVHRGGMAILSAMVSRAYLQDLRRAHREGGMPTVDDPTRGN